VYQNFGIHERLKMARTTSTAVALIIEVNASISLTPFIEIANAFVTECCSSVTTYDAARLELIERWLSAHCYTIRDMRAESEKASDVSEKKQSKVDLGFDTSHYGQIAMRIDTAGGLAKLNEEAKSGGIQAVGVSWLGDEDLSVED